MALGLLGRGSLQGLTASGYALAPRFPPHVVRGYKLPHPKRARAIFGFLGGTQHFKMPVPSKNHLPITFNSLIRIFPHYLSKAS